MAYTFIDICKRAAFTAAVRFLLFNIDSGTAGSVLAGDVVSSLHRKK